MIFTRRAVMAATRSFATSVPAVRAAEGRRAIHVLM